MATIEWRNDFSVNIGSIDKQHKAFINMFNEFVEAYQEGEAPDILYDTLKEMLDYLNNHFSEEESVMEKYGYPGLEEHRKEHMAFSGKTNEFIDDYFDGRQDLDEKMLNYLSDWFIGHVMGTDMKYVPFFKDKGVS